MLHHRPPATSWRRACTDTLSAWVGCVAVSYACCACGVCVCAAGNGRDGSDSSSEGKSGKQRGGGGSGSGSKGENATSRLRCIWVAVLLHPDRYNAPPLLLQRTTTAKRHWRSHARVRSRLSCDCDCCCCAMTAAPLSPVQWTPVALKPSPTPVIVAAIRKRRYGGALDYFKMRPTCMVQNTERAGL